MTGISRKVLEERVELLRKVRDGKIDFREFNLLSMHKETADLLAKNKPTLSEKGLSTLNAIEMYLSSIPRNTKDVAYP